MSEESTVMTFDEILTGDKSYQSEFDRRVTKALETAKETWETAQGSTAEAAKAELFGKMGVKDEKELEATLAYLEAKRKADEQAEADKPEIEQLRNYKADTEQAISKLQKQLDKLTAENETYKLNESVAKKGLTGDAAELAVLRIEKMVASGKKVDDAISEYFEANPVENSKEPNQPPPEVFPRTAPATVTTTINPWAKETRNLTEQTRIYRENPQLAKQMASEAGIKI